MKSDKKLWGGRFQEKAAGIMEKIGESVSFDKRLYREDITGSMAHARLLYRAKILSDQELEDILNGLGEIRSEIESGKFSFSPELEDIHMNIESRLTEKIGQAGKKLHTGRSRNDQVSVDCRLYIRNEIDEIRGLILGLLEVLYQRAGESVDIIIPGYTHLQVAQPIRFSHYLLAWFQAFYRDFQQFETAERVNDLYVLGSGAMAGVNYPLDREYGRELLGFSALSENSMDAVAQRDHFLNFLFACSQLMVHASRICEEIIIYTSVEFAFLRLPDSLTTGSSIMPQKKNPDIAELVRGKSARVISSLNHMFIMLKGLPLTYNRDLQEDKIALFDAADQVKLSIEGITAMIAGMVVQEERALRSLQDGFSTATDLADFLVNDKGVPFREAHEIVGELVALCVSQKTTLFDISADARNGVSALFADETEYMNAISLAGSADKKDVYGGTARRRQLEQLGVAEEILKKHRRS